MYNNCYGLARVWAACALPTGIQRTHGEECRIPRP